MTDKIIEEVEEKYEGEVGSKKKIATIDSIFTELNNTKRDVNKLLGAMKYSSESVPHRKQDSKTNDNKSPNKSIPISKYNYYGKKYRFELKQQQLHVDPPEMQRLCGSEVNFQMKNSHPLSPRTQKQKNYSNNAVIDQSLFFDDGQIKMPSEKYFIYFDQPNRKLPPKKPNKLTKQVHFEDAEIKKFKPAWLMEKKINSLQKQLKQMKEREKRRYQDQAGQTKMMRNTYDNPIKLQSNIERMVETLWI